jgi:hypothetical protein
MHALIDSPRYDPELVKLMTDALDSAWRKIETRAESAELARLVLAGAIIDAVDGGSREREELVAKAVAALAAAVSVTGEKLKMKRRK